MNFWFGWVITLATAYSSANFIYQAYKHKSLMFGAFGIALLSAGLSVSLQTISLYTVDFLDNPILSTAVGWANVFSITFAYSGLILLVRNAKPVFARFPIAFGVVPLFILLIYPLIMSSPVILTWLMLIFEAGWLIITSLVYWALSKKYKEYKRLLYVSLFQLVPFVAYWIHGIYEKADWFWQLSLAVIIILFYYQYERLIKSNTPLEIYEYDNISN